MKLPSAARHLRLKHWRCLSCTAELTMLNGMMEGRGFFFTGDPFRLTTPAKA